MICFSCARYSIPCEHQPPPEHIRIRLIIESMRPPDIIIPPEIKPKVIRNYKDVERRERAKRRIRQALAQKSPYVDVGISGRVE